MLGLVQRGGADRKAGVRLEHLGQLAVNPLGIDLPEALLPPLLSILIPDHDIDG